MDHIMGGTQEWMWLGGLGSRKPSSRKSASSAVRNVKYHLQADHSGIHMAGFPVLHSSRLRKKESLLLPLAWEKEEWDGGNKPKEVVRVGKEVASVYPVVTQISQIYGRIFTARLGLVPNSLLGSKVFTWRHYD